ncbi:MAG: hypothetical protein ABI851_14375 [Saprospiraceae bacterium]
MVENRIVAFIDILGFREIIVNAPDNYTFIYSTLKRVLDTFKQLDTETEFNFTHFSDSFVLSLRDFNVNQSMLFLIILQDLISDLINDGILLRGGISVGKSIHDDDILLGEGLIKAYDLEQKAKFPRVIIDGELVEHWEDQLEGYNFENVFELTKDSDGYYFMDYITKKNGLTANYLDKITKIAFKMKTNQSDSVKAKGEWLFNWIAVGYKILEKK